MVAFVHVSDIHFHRLYSQPGFDPNRSLRDELVRDARIQTKDRGPITGILVTGDIAFSAHEDEYQLAAEWLNELAAAVECETSAVWTTPGNHDIIRRVIDDSMVLQSIHSTIRDGDGGIDARLQKLLLDPVGSTSIFAPLAAYNEFAARYQCELSAERLVWTHDFRLDDRYILRVCGLNSTLVSSKKDSATSHRLVLGDITQFLRREEGVIYMTLCHHPPSWLLDHDAAEAAFVSRASVQLFGHKHSQRLTQIENCVRMVAGAVIPDREEASWQPRYNLVSIAVETSDLHPTLLVRIAARVWDANETCFVAAPGGDADWTRTVRLSLEPSAPRASNTRSTVEGSAMVLPPSSSPELDAVRQLTHDFMTLPYHLKVSIAERLSLVEEEDKSVTDTERFRRVFRRAAERRQLSGLWTAVQAAHGRVEGSNPFEGR